MPGKSEKIHPQRPHVHRHMGHALRAVADEDGPGLMRDPREGPDVVLPPEHVGDLRHRHQARPLRQRAAESLFRDDPRRVAFDPPEHGAGPPRQLLPWQEVAVVLRHGDGDLVARLQARSVAVRDEVQALRRVPRENDLLSAPGAYEVADRLPRFLVGIRRPLRQRIQPPQRIGIARLVEIADRAQHRFRLLRRRGIVEIGEGRPAREQGKVPAHRLHVHHASSPPSPPCSCSRTRACTCASGIFPMTASIFACASIPQAVSASMPREAI